MTMRHEIWCTKPFGTWSLHGGYGVYVYDLDAYTMTARYQWVKEGEADSRVWTARIYDTANDRYFFRTRGRRVYLDEIVKSGF